MKKVLLFLLMLAMTTIGCHQGDVSFNMQNRVTLQAFQDATTRVTFNGQKSLWSDKDCLNVIVDGLDEIYPFNYDISSDNNFVCDNIQLPTNVNDFYAFYGVEADDINITDKIAAVDLSSTTQIQDAQQPTLHIAQYDILYGKALSAYTDNICIAMEHTVAAVKINISNSLQTTKTIKNVTFSTPEGVTLSGNHTINLSTNTISAVSSDNNSNNVQLSFNEPLLLEDDGTTHTVWIATAPFELTGGDELIIDITTIDDEVYRCTKSISDNGIAFNAGSIMSTDISLGVNAQILEADSSDESELPEEINLVIDPAIEGVMPNTFPSLAKDNVTTGEYTICGYKFIFSSPSPFYISSNNRIRFESGITNSDVAMIKLPVISKYRLTSVILASTAANNTRNYMFAITNDVQEVIDGGTAYKLTDAQHTYNLTLPSDNTTCCICISHKTSSGNTNSVDLSYISLQYTKIN